MTRTQVVHSSHWGAFVADVDGGRVVSTAPFPGDPDPSPQVSSISDALTADVRVETPCVRKSGLDHGPASAPELRGKDPYVAVSWDTALDLVAGELRRVRDEHGSSAVFGGSYGWSSAGRFHHAKTQLTRFLNCFGGCTDQIGNYSYAAAAAILPHVVGSASPTSGTVTSWSSIVENTGLWVMFGGMPLRNAQVESGGIARHNTSPELRRTRAAGVEFVAFTPLRVDVPEFLDAQWVAPRPNTDTAIMLGLAHTLLTEDLHDEEFLNRYCVGWERFSEYLTGAADGRPKTAEWAADIADVDAHELKELARRMASTRTLITATWSLQRADHGEQPFWATIALAAMLGQIGLPGGGFSFGFANASGIGNVKQPFSVPNMPAGTNPTGSAIPVARIVDMLLNPGAEYDFDGKRMRYPDTRLVYWAGGNPFHHHQDINRLLEAWRRPETIVVHEPWWTATARHADIVLPATTTLERNDIGAASRDSFVIAMQQAVEPIGAARNDYDIFTDLAARLGIVDAFTEGRDETGWLQHLYDTFRDGAQRHGVAVPDFETFWKQGHAELPTWPAHVLLGDYRADPDGQPLRTPSGRIELFSATIDGFGYDDCPGHPVWLEPGEWLGAQQAQEFPLHLLSVQPATRLHGQLDMGRVSAANKVRGREPVVMHPSDAAARGISDGDIVVVRNDRGRCLAGARVDDGIRPGVVQLATGAWYDPVEPGRIGALDKHGNPNVLTPDHGTSKLGQGPSAHSALVEVEPYTDALPEISVFDPPAVEPA
ncbi:MAG: molybdopterin guanine dinucleotide-containing S/N-oxide reductase [Streptosporangiales bacterium]|nr:molybdopterin guanine dinucleotide-containing S/N-oxide reductase [Streptosporangiales bacterium]